MKLVKFEVCVYVFKLSLVIRLLLGECLATLSEHNDEILDVVFDITGGRVATASADGTARCYNTTTYELLSTMIGHEGEISKVSQYLLFSMNSAHLCMFFKYVQVWLMQNF